MGGSTAEIAWGFIIPEDKLSALLHCLREHASRHTSKSGGEDPGGREGDNKDEDEDREEDAEEYELEKYVESILTKGEHWKVFGYRFLGGADYQKSEALLIFYNDSYARVDKENDYSYTKDYKALGKNLRSCEGVSEELLKKLRMGLHLAEIGMEAPVEEEWYLSLTADVC